MFLVCLKNIYYKHLTNNPSSVIIRLKKVRENPISSLV
nr:MAG TPA: hypothetical protein [Siphoviridae sp. ctngg6]